MSNPKFEMSSEDPLHRETERKSEQGQRSWPDAERRLKHDLINDKPGEVLAEQLRSQETSHEEAKNCRLNWNIHLSRVGRAARFLSLKTILIDEWLKSVQMIVHVERPR